LTTTSIPFYPPLLEGISSYNLFEYHPLLHSPLGEGSISRQVSPAVSRVYAACSFFQVIWELPPVQVVCSRNFHYVMEINSSELNSPIKNELLTELCRFGWGLERNKTYSVRLTTFSLSGKAVGSPWRQEVTITPSGIRFVMCGLNGLCMVWGDTCPFKPYRALLNHHFSKVYYNFEFELKTVTIDKLLPF